MILDATRPLAPLRLKSAQLRALRSISLADQFSKIPNTPKVPLHLRWQYRALCIQSYRNSFQHRIACEGYRIAHLAITRDTGIGPSFDRIWIGGAPLHNSYLFTFVCRMSIAITVTTFRPGSGPSILEKVLIELFRGPPSQRRGIKKVDLVWLAPCLATAFRGCLLLHVFGTAAKLTDNLPDPGDNPDDQTPHRLVRQIANVIDAR